MSQPTPRPLSALESADLGKAFGLLQSGRAVEALAIGRRLLASSPTAPDAHHLHAICLAETGDFEASGLAFMKALELSPAHPLILSNYAAMLRKSGQFYSALEVAQDAVESAPASAKAWTELGLTAEAAGDAARALKSAQHAVHLQPGLILAWQILGRAAREMEDLETAAYAFERIIALDPTQRSAWTSLGMVQRLAGQPEAAVERLERAVRELGSSPELADALAGALLDAGRPDEAIELGRATVLQHAGFVPALVTLAQLAWEYPAQAPGLDANALFSDAIRQQPDNVALGVAHVRFLLATEAPRDALVEIRRLQVRTDQPWLALLEAHALEASGQTLAAGDVHAKLHATTAGASPDYLNAYAHQLLRVGKPDAAAEMAMQATQVDPCNQQAWAYLATAWRLLGDARELWLCDYERLIALVDVEPPAPFPEREPFLEALTDVLAPRHRALRAPMQQSLRNGSQTPGRLFGGPDPLLAATKASLIDAVERWLATLPDDPTHPFLGRKRSGIRIGGSWSVKLWSSGAHVNHIHSEGWISSAFYVALPPSVSGGQKDQTAHPGAIQFGQPPVELELGLPPRRLVVPEAGKLALFPSYMWHGTVPFTDESPRMTIAFDMIPRVEERRT